jgi:hypothetical protein
VWPVGVVSTTNTPRRASLTSREKAWKTATSTVHGERSSSSSRARPASSSGGGECPPGVGTTLRLRVDPTDSQPLDLVRKRICQVRRGIRGAQVRGNATPGQLHCERRTKRGLPHTTLAHDHDGAVSGIRDLVDRGSQFRKSITRHRSTSLGAHLVGRSWSLHQRTQRRDAH